MPEIFESAKPISEGAELACSFTRDNSGQLIYAKFPCVITDFSTQTLQGVGTTGISSDPKGAALFINGEFIAYTPANLVFGRWGDGSKVHTINIKKDGFEEGVVEIQEGRTYMLKLTAKQATH